MAIQGDEAGAGPVESAAEKVSPSPAAATIGPGGTGGEAPANFAAGHKAVQRAVMIVCVVAIVFLCGQILMFGYGRDQSIYAMVADAILRGKMPYRDAWDFKPPGIFVIYGISRLFFGPAQVGIRVIEVAGLLATCVALVRLSERFFRSRMAGFLAAALAVLAHAQLDFWHTAQPESFGGYLTVFAILLAARTPEEPVASKRAVYFAGVLFGLTGLLKPPLAGGGALLALYLAHREWHSFVAADTVSVSTSGDRSGAKPAGSTGARWIAAARPALWITLGGATPMVLCALWFAARGALGDLYQVLFVFTPHYTKLGWEGSSVGGMFYWSFIEWLTSYCSALSIGVLCALGFGVDRREKPFTLFVAGIIAMHLVGVTMQAKFFPYHYGATWPLTALLAGVGFEKLRVRLAPRGAFGAAAFVVIVVLSCFGRSGTKDTEDAFMVRCKKRVGFLLGGLRDQEGIDRLATIADVSAGANRRVAAILREQVPADRPIFVWGFEPVIYDQSDRRPASRFLYNVPQRVGWSKGPMRATLLRDLAEHPPAAVVVEHRDVFPMVTGDAIDSADTLYDFWDFYVFLQKYRLYMKVEDLDVYLEKDAPTSPPP